MLKTDTYKSCMENEIFNNDNKYFISYAYKCNCQAIKYILQNVFNLKYIVFKNEI